MYSSDLLFLLGAVLPAVLANPIVWNATEAAEWRRDAAHGSPNVYVCTGVSFTGDCGWWFPDLDNSPCLSLGYKPMSIGPDPKIVCTLFKDNDCHSHREPYTFFHPGNSDLASQSGMSLKCKYGDGNFSGFKPDPVPADKPGIQT